MAPKRSKKTGLQSGGVGDRGGRPGSNPRGSLQAFTAERSYSLLISSLHEPERVSTFRLCRNMAITGYVQKHMRKF